MVEELYHERVAGTASLRQKKGMVYFGDEESKCSGPTSSLTSSGVFLGQTNSISKKNTITNYNDRKMLTQERFF